MPGMKAPGGKPPLGAGRGALLGDIQHGARLKKVTVVNDRSAPMVGKVSDGPSAAPMGAPAIPGMGKPPAPPGLAPPVPGNRARSNSDTGGGESAMAAAPQLGGLFAGGMPKLRKSGGVNTGADTTNTPYLSDPETSRSSAPKPPRGMAPRPPIAPPGAPPAPPISGLRPQLKSIGALESRPVSTASTIGGKPKPPPPIGKKPPIPPPSSRKPSGLAPPPPASPARAPPVPGSAPPAPPPLPPTSTPSAPPPPPPGLAPPPRPSGSVPPAPPLPPSSAPRAPARSTPPPPPSLAPPPPASAQNDEDEYDPYKYDSRAPSAPAPPPPKASPMNGHAPSLAEQAARNAFGRASPAAAPPPPPGPAPSSPLSLPTASAPPPPPSSAAPSRPASQAPSRSMSSLDPSLYTLTNGGSGIKSPTGPGMGSGGSKGKVIPIHDLRWRFQDEAQFPRPRDFTNGPKKYRAGRGSSVPLDLSAYE
ncbi:hypothetical protein ACN47E_005151 [Coniothyrium glycines]